MKFMWFHLMPYTELPEDFRDKHPSVWVDIHSSLFDPRLNGTQALELAFMVAELLRAAKQQRKLPLAAE